MDTQSMHVSKVDYTRGWDGPASLLLLPAAAAAARSARTRSHSGRCAFQCALQQAWLQ